VTHHEWFVPVKVPLRLGVHEAAHAIARLVLNETLPGPMLQRVSVRPEPGRLGVSVQQLRNIRAIPRTVLATLPEEVRVDVIRGAEFDIIETFAGPIAEARYKRRSRSAPVLMELTVVQTTIALDPHAAGEDAHRVRRTLEWIAPADPAETLGDLWRRAVQLVEEEYPGIVRMGRILSSAGELDGDAFEASWRKVRRLRNGREVSTACGQARCRDVCPVTSEELLGE
jgi:hypothetical protein